MVGTGIESALIVAARLLFGGVMAFVGLNHFLQLDQMAGYAGFRGLPAPKLSVVASGGLLVPGGIGIIAGAFPYVSALAVAGFLLVSALTMRDFWAVYDDQKQDAMTPFLKNVVASGGVVYEMATTGTGSVRDRCETDIGPELGTSPGRSERPREPRRTISETIAAAAVTRR